MGGIGNGVVIVDRRVLCDGRTEVTVVKGLSRPTRLVLPRSARTLVEQDAAVEAWAASPPRTRGKRK